MRISEWITKDEKKKNVGWVGGWIHGWTKIKVSTWMKTCEWKLMSNVEK